MSSAFVLSRLTRKSVRGTREELEQLVRDEIELVDAGDEAKELFAAVALSEQLEDFLTLPAYERLDEEESR